MSTNIWRAYTLRRQRHSAVWAIPGGGIRSKGMESEKGKNPKKQNKTEKPHRAKIQLKATQTKVLMKMIYNPYPPHWGCGDFLRGRKLSIWDIWEDCRSALLLAELKERAVPWCWETNRSLSGQQVSHQHCQLESFRQEVKVIFVSNWNHKRKVCLE